MIPQIVLIDSGVNTDIIKCETYDKLSKGIEDKCGHGTACAMVINNICPEAKIISMPLLNQNAQASDKELEILLKYCLELDCDIINLSLSVINDTAGELHGLCEELRRRGKIVLSSVTNRKSKSIPALYGNVIGVRGKIFSSSNEYWFNKNKQIQMITDMTPIFTDISLGRYFIFSGNSKSTAVASGIVANILKNYGKIRYEELVALMTLNASETEWSELTVKSQLSGLIDDNGNENGEIIQISKTIKSIICKELAIEDILENDSDLFSKGIITVDTISSLLKEIGRCFSIDINFLNITPKDIITVNNLSAAVRRICDDKANRNI